MTKEDKIRQALKKELECFNWCGYWSGYWYSGQDFSKSHWRIGLVEKVKGQGDEMQFYRKELRFEADDKMNYIIASEKSDASRVLTGPWLDINGERQYSHHAESLNDDPTYWPLHVKQSLDKEIEKCIDWFHNHKKELLEFHKRDVEHAFKKYNNRLKKAKEKYILAKNVCDGPKKELSRLSKMEKRSFA